LELLLLLLLQANLSPLQLQAMQQLPQSAHL
jgi:hypothetical protein